MFEDLGFGGMVEWSRSTILKSGAGSRTSLRVAGTQGSGGYLLLREPSACSPVSVLRAAPEAHTARQQISRVYRITTPTSTMFRVRSEEEVLIRSVGMIVARCMTMNQLQSGYSVLVPWYSHQAKVSQRLI
jgi:hypothetical protein